MPRPNSLRLLGKTQAKAKMWEYDVPEEEHVRPSGAPLLFDLAVGALGDACATVNGEPVLDPLDAAFAAEFFDAFRRARIDERLSDFCCLCAAACYYLQDMPGTSTVLAGLLRPESLATPHERLLAWLLNPSGPILRPSRTDSELCSAVADAFESFLSTGKLADDIAVHAKALADEAYALESPRQVLLSDAILAVCARRVRNSSWTRLPEYSGIPVGDWGGYIGQAKAILELWPAQRLMGAAGLYAGESAVVQMPTSAGKTRAVELMLRSAFLSGRAKAAIIVAPFRALCREITADLAEAFAGEPVHVDELTDALQVDYSLESANEADFTVLVATPEKTQYMLRHSPEIAERVGLTIYDEAHLFDDTSRGVNYELLLSSLKSRLAEKGQTVLISAVMRNAADVAEWLLEERSAVVEGSGILPTARSIGLVNWTGAEGRLEFPAIEGAQQHEYYVPRVIRQETLTSGEVFPEKDKPGEIALHVALRLSAKGGAAIFCGTKEIAGGIVNKFVDIKDELAIAALPLSHSDSDECQLLADQLKENLGEAAPATAAARMGVLIHHASIPDGSRRCEEYALQADKARVVVCTSTLAQGVNLPIRYLIIPGVRQGIVKLKTRDFLNLMGRAGRAGKHTEGSIVFTDRLIDLGRAHGPRSDTWWRWAETLALLDPSRSEECTSAIALLFDPLYNQRRNDWVTVEPLDLAKVYLDDPEGYLDIADTVHTAHRSAGFSRSDLLRQLSSKMAALRAIQSYLMTASMTDETPTAVEIAESTLAYSLAGDRQKKQIVELFEMLAEATLESVPDEGRRVLYGRTLLSANECKAIEAWALERRDEMEGQSDDSLVALVQPLLLRFVSNTNVRRCSDTVSRDKAFLSWVGGEPFHSIEQHLKDARVGTDKRSRRYSIDRVVDFCQNGLGFDAALVLSALADIVEALGASEETVIALHRLHKRLRYGLPTTGSVCVYELGFADRVLAQRLAEEFQLEGLSKGEARFALATRIVDLRAVLETWPSYFGTVASRLDREAPPE